MQLEAIQELADRFVKLAGADELSAEDRREIDLAMANRQTLSVLGQ